MSHTDHKPRAPLRNAIDALEDHLRRVPQPEWHGRDRAWLGWLPKRQRETEAVDLQWSRRFARCRSIRPRRTVGTLRRAENWKRSHRVWPAVANDGAAPRGSSADESRHRRGCHGDIPRTSRPWSRVVAPRRQATGGGAPGGRLAAGPRRRRLHGRGRVCARGVRVIGRTNVDATQLGRARLAERRLARVRVQRGRLRGRGVPATERNSSPWVCDVLQEDGISALR